MVNLQEQSTVRQLSPAEKKEIMDDLSNIAYSFTPVIQQKENRDKIDYELRLRQQPKHARMCGVGEKADRRPIDPPPIVQLKVRDLTAVGTHGRNVYLKPRVPPPAADASEEPEDGEAADDETEDGNKPKEKQKKKSKDLLNMPPVGTPAPNSGLNAGSSITQNFLQNPYYFMYACLMSGDENSDEELHVLKDGKTRYTTGSVVSSLYHLKDTDQTDAGFFCFPDLSVRIEGNYRLKLSLFEIIDKEVHHCKTIFSDSFYVYSAKRFPGMDQSTLLSRTFAEQGMKIRIRKELRPKRSGTSSGKRKGDASDEEMASDEEAPSTSGGRESGGKESFKRPRTSSDIDPLQREGEHYPSRPYPPPPQMMQGPSDYSRESTLHTFQYQHPDARYPPAQVYGSPHGGPPYGTSYFSSSQPVWQDRVIPLLRSDFGGPNVSLVRNQPQSTAGSRPVSPSSHSRPLSPPQAVSHMGRGLLLTSSYTPPESSPSSSSDVTGLRSLPHPPPLPRSSSWDQERRIIAPPRAFNIGPNTSQATTAYTREMVMVDHGTHLAYESAPSLHQHRPDDSHPTGLPGTPPALNILVHTAEDSGPGASSETASRGPSVSPSTEPSQPTLGATTSLRNILNEDNVPPPRSKMKLSDLLG